MCGECRDAVVRSMLRLSCVCLWNPMACVLPMFSDIQYRVFAYRILVTYFYQPPPCDESCVMRGFM